MNNKSYRLISVIMITIIALLSVLLVITFTDFQLQATKDIKKVTYDELSGDALELKKNFNLQLSGDRSLLSSVASIIGSYGDGVISEKTLDYFNCITNDTDNSFAFIGLAYGDGMMYLSNGDVFSVKEEEAYKSAMRGEESLFASEYPNDKNVFVYSHPVMGADGVPIGILSGYYYEAVFQSITVNKTDESYSMICDKNGDIVIGASFFELFGGKNIFVILPNAEFYESNAENIKSDYSTSIGGLCNFTYKGIEIYMAYEPLGVNDWMIMNIIKADSLNPTLLDMRYVSWSTMTHATVMVVAICALLIASLYIYQKKEQQSRIELMLSHIKPHFLYNTLSAIYSLIMYEPKTASEMVYNFSHYMRTNIDILTVDKLVPFESELKHAKSYSNIETVRFAPQVNVLYDIRETGFMLPPLSLQPIVENAIKHGLRAKSGGGTVTVTVTREKKYFNIVVNDDGAGFDTDKLKNRERMGSLDNVRYRLKYMCRGRLTINSKECEGTTVVISIPLKYAYEETEE